MNSPHKAKPNLAALWDRYAANAAASRSPEWSLRLGDWPVYAAATGAVLASTTSAGVSVITGTFNTIATVQQVGTCNAHRRLSFLSTLGARLGVLSINATGQPLWGFPHTVRYGKRRASAPAPETHVA
jgi:hypothetical protein